MVNGKNKVILMKLTSRERPDILIKTVSEYIRLANNTKDMVWLFSLDEEDLLCSNDEFLIKLFESLEPDNITRCYCKRSLSKVDAINRDVNYFLPEWDILLNISDDQRPIVKGYDDIIRDTMPEHLDASLWFSDGSPRINTQEIIGKAYYDRFGYIYHPDFKSFYCDNLATDLALFQGKCIKSSKQITDHLHPAWKKTNSIPMDDLYRRNQKYWDEDKATYERLISQGLDKLIPRT